MATRSDLINEALGSGLAFPFRIHQGGGLALSRDEEKIKESIMLILATARGERVMRPDFGCDIHAFTFTSLDSTNLTLIKSAVRESLLLWEPRIDVGEIEAVIDPNQPGHVHISVNYTIRLTNSVFNLVYPFNVESGG